MTVFVRPVASPSTVWKVYIKGLIAEPWFWNTREEALAQADAILAERYRKGYGCSRLTVWDERGKAKRSTYKPSETP